MSPEQYLDLKKALIDCGYANEIDWADDIKPCENAISFFCDYAWVVLNSGMKNQVAKKIWDKIKAALLDGKDIAEVFNHKGKVNAIKHVWLNQYRLFDAYNDAVDSAFD